MAAVVRDYYKANGATPEFVSVCFDENGAFSRHHTGERRLTANEAVLIDIGARSDGYPTDMTRVAFCGELSDEFREVHAVLERAVAAAVATAGASVRAKDVDKVARDMITEAGYRAFFLHRTGHGMRIDIHEPPYITATAETILEEGHVFSIEPGIYLSGKFGARLEEIVIIRGDRAEILSESSRAAFEVTI